MNQKGMTLIEIMVVFMILAISTMSVLFFLIGFQKYEERTRILSQPIPNQIEVIE